MMYQDSLSPYEKTCVWIFNNNNNSEPLLLLREVTN